MLSNTNECNNKMHWDFWGYFANEGSHKSVGKGTIIHVTHSCLYLIRLTFKAGWKIQLTFCVFRLDKAHIIISNTLHFNCENGRWLVISFLFILLHNIYNTHMYIYLYIYVYNLIIWNIMIKITFLL